MSGQRKRKDSPPPDVERFAPKVPAAVVTLPEEQEPPPPISTIVRCAECKFGQDVSIGARRCRRNPPVPLYRNVHGARGELAADPMWPRVHESDYCGEGVQKP